MVEDDRMSVDAYREALRYLGRMPEWASRWMEFHFSEAVARFAAIEPKAHLYIQDRLRGSPLLFYGALVDGLIRDANRQAGIEHELFGQRVGGGLRALNPGMARGRLYEPDDVGADRSFDRNGIFLLPETVSDLPPVGGILTRGEGSSLSHVQLLARNLGIPNVVVGDVHLDAVRRHVGDRVVLAVSPNGVVQLADDGARWNEVFGREGPAADLVIRPDLEKLDLSTTGFKSISELRASDSGRVSGPKGANLGELKHHFGDQVPGGFVIPFGAFRQVLEQPVEPGGPSTFDWMKQQYDTIARLEGQPVAREKAVRSFLSRLRKWITRVDPGPEFREQLRSALRRHFGRSGTYGVFVRSDTNVEDLPGFTGAGLNLTVPNVVGEEQVLDAVRRVWASPFTERAFGWRQDKMEQPEYVFPAVVIQEAFPSEKSGVMVTADVDTGDMDWITVAVNEGVGGAVDGQAAESLRIRKRDGQVDFLARATAPRRAVLDTDGGMDRVPASGTEAVLTPREIDALVRFAREVPDRFPALRDERGQAVPADVEFAFKDGRLTLLQIRPFVESRGAKASRHLASLDASLREKGRQTVRLDRPPED
jgi:diadenosine tetraphosphatase ApaH/serine/threonine PP2A family protein phosphatase